jgi:hypothetical protein
MNGDIKVIRRWGGLPIIIVAGGRVAFVAAGVRRRFGMTSISSGDVMSSDGRNSACKDLIAVLCQYEVVWVARDC